MTGNAKYNKKFAIESSDSGAPSGNSESALEPDASDLELAYEAALEPASGASSGTPSGLRTGPRVDESSVMVSGMVPLVIEFEGKPIWISTDLNSKRAFRPSRVKFEVSFEYLLMCGDCQIIVALALRNSSSCH